MDLSQFVDQLDQLAAQAELAFAEASSAECLEEARVEFAGARSGRFKSIQKQMGALAAEDRPLGGKKLNEAKARIQTALDEATSRLGGASGTASKAIGPQLDPTLPGLQRHLGSTHPITQTIEHLKEIMGRLGFTPVEGPEVEDTWHNFVALNIPEDHPARDPLDNFYLASAGGSIDTSVEGARLLRSQTSTVQIRVMENSQPPIRVISLGRVYRPDEADRTHFPMFHQMEGLWIDREVTMSQLKSVLRMFASSYLGEDVEIRFRPSFFPFTEPSVEVDFHWNDSWIEFGGAGMVDPNVLQAVGYDPESVTGFAFGLGVERLCMRRHGIEDIRDLYRNDLRFLHQF
jgi:phenylalanyl-tRNA synthetase alpha chain